MAVNSLYMNANGTGSAPATGRGLTKGQVLLYRAGALILAAGLSGAAWAYVRATRSPELPGAIPGVQETKIDQYRMELYGGKANILANDFQSWFDALWHGRELAYTLAVLAIVIGLACFLLAEHLPKIPAFPPADHDRRAKPGESAGLTPQPPADSNSAAKPNSKTP